MKGFMDFTVENFMYFLSQLISSLELLLVRFECSLSGAFPVVFIKKRIPFSILILLRTSF